MVVCVICSHKIMQKTQIIMDRDGLKHVPVPDEMHSEPGQPLPTTLAAAKGQKFHHSYFQLSTLRCGIFRKLIKNVTLIAVAGSPSSGRADGGNITLKQCHLNDG